MVEGFGKGKVSGGVGKFFWRLKKERILQRRKKVAKKEERGGRSFPPLGRRSAPRPPFVVYIGRRSKFGPKNLCSPTF